MAYRGDDYKVHILDAYCPHMGADLAKGEVIGTNIVCPFHHWQWGSDGVCQSIPYSESIPKKACIKSWPTLEKNGLLYIGLRGREPRKHECLFWGCYFPENRPPPVAKTESISVDGSANV